MADGLMAGADADSVGSMKLVNFPVLILASLIFCLGCSSSEKFDTSTPEGAFKAAEALEKEERYEEAIPRFQEVKNKHPYSRFATEAELKIADIHYAAESFEEAQATYQLFKEFHPKHPRIDYVTFRLGMSFYMQLPDTIDRDISLAEKAVLYFDEVVRNYPTSPHAAEAQEKRTASLKKQAEKEMYIANFYFIRDMYDSALKRFEVVLKTYPNLGFEPKALYGAAKSAFEVGEKDRAEQHSKNLRAAFPESSEAKQAASEFRKYGTN